MFKVYLAEVIENNDETGQGNIRVKIPGLNLEYRENIFPARPICFPFISNETIKDENVHVGSFCIPPKGSLVLSFVSESSNEVFYFGGVVPSNQHSSLLPESSLDEPEKRYVLLRSQSGSSIIISEAEIDKGVTITGKKKKYDPQKAKESVLPVEENQSTIKINNKNDEILIYGLEKIVVKTDNGSIILDKEGNLFIQCKSLVINSEGEILMDTPGVVTTNKFVGMLRGVADVARTCR